MRPHVEILGWLHQCWGVFGILTGASLLLLALGASVALGGGSGAVDSGLPPDRTPVWLLGLSGSLFAMSGLVMKIVGRALVSYLPWSRRTALLLAVPHLLVVPFGSALAIYTVWTLLNDDARRTFGRPTRLTPTAAG